MTPACGNEARSGGQPTLCVESSTAYLRAAHAYILISIPTGTSTILGAFQAIPGAPFAK